ncbi:MAG: hypothetical protein ACE5R4_16560 [Armatimonadota bacterium]
MRCVRLPLAVTIVTALAVGALAAQEKIALQQKFKPGLELLYAFTMTGVGGMDIRGPGAPQGATDYFIDMGIDIRQKHRSVDENGVGEIELSLDRMQMNQQMAGMDQAIELEDGQLRVLVNGEVMFDTADPEAGQDNPLALLVGQSLVLRIDPTGKLVGLPQLPLLKKLVPGIGDIDVEKLLEMGKGDLPPEPVAVGETWEVDQPIPFITTAEGTPPVQKTVCKLEGLEQVLGRNCARITSTTELDAAGTSMPMPSPMPMGPANAKVSIDMRGMEFNFMQTRWFDYENGIDVKLTMDMEMSMDIGETIEFEQDGKQQKIELDIKIEGLEMIGEMVLVG